MALLTCEKLTREPWFRELDLELEAGEVVVLRGPSGSGKTLLLRSIADLDPLDSGRILLEGREPESMEPAQWRRSVLYVHQSGVRFPGTVRSNLERIAVLAAVAGGSAPDLRDVPGIDPQADAERLSGGEAQRLALHRALLCRPRVLLLDESTGALDREASLTAEARILEFAAEGNAALWVTHDVTLAQRLGARELRFP